MCIRDSDQRERVSLTPVRRMIASNMTKSVTSIPHAWTMMSADLSNIVKVRNRLKEDFQTLVFHLKSPTSSMLGW